MSRSERASSPVRLLRQSSASPGGHFRSLLMPSINGITAFIETHDGPLPEFGHDEFGGGKSCYIPAQSGQQFWLHYIFYKPFPWKAASVEFYVDGQRVDAQFPLPRRNTDCPTVGLVNSTIKSQYGKTMNDEGKIVVWRREVFFSLIKPDKHVNICCTTKPASELAAASPYGTIDCKVFRSERTPEWAGAVVPDDFCPPSKIIKLLKGRHVSHVARLGVKMEASPVKRFCVKSLDPDDTPFAWFKFYYRSRGQLVEKFNLNLLPGVIHSNSNQRGFASERAPLELPADIHKTIEPSSLVHRVSEIDNGASSLDNVIQKLEEELAAAEAAGLGEKEEVLTCHKKISKLRENSKKLRLADSASRKFTPDNVG